MIIDEPTLKELMKKVPAAMKEINMAPTEPDKKPLRKLYLKRTNNKPYEEKIQNVEESIEKCGKPKIAKPRLLAKHKATICEKPNIKEKHDDKCIENYKEKKTNPEAKKPLTKPKVTMRKKPSTNIESEKEEKKKNIPHCKVRLDINTRLVYVTRFPTRADHTCAPTHITEPRLFRRCGKKASSSPSEPVIEACPQESEHCYNVSIDDSMHILENCDVVTERETVGSAGDTMVGAVRSLEQFASTFLPESNSLEVETRKLDVLQEVNSLAEDVRTLRRSPDVDHVQGKIAEIRQFIASVQRIDNNLDHG